MKKKGYIKKLPIQRSGLYKACAAVCLSRLDIELTNRCNNDCIHCCVNLEEGDIRAKEKELSTEEIKKILREAVELGCVSVRFTGGEPLLRKDFEELYIFSRKLGLMVLLFTNATLITRHVAELFSKIPPLKNIEVTLYGMKQESYETVTRVSGSYKAAWHGIELLLEYNVPFAVRFAILPCNKNEIESFEKWVKCIPWAKPPYYALFFDLRCRRDDAVKNRLIERLRINPEEGVRLLMKGRDYQEDLLTFCSKLGCHNQRLFFCAENIHGIGVDASGYFQRCLVLRHPDIQYDIRKGSLKDALTNFVPKIRGMEAVNPVYLERCAVCFLKGACEQCPARSWMEYGDLDTPVEYLCEITHARARYFGLLAEGEHAWEIKDWQNRARLARNRISADYNITEELHAKN